MLRELSCSGADFSYNWNNLFDLNLNCIPLFGAYLTSVPVLAAGGNVAVRQKKHAL
ncbi:hypothetical protein SISNIDRAFT_175322 [Sistotremastrum niveocremeum HHB9708]|uniref:Uncharacterized protein n=1 Tax=Sistotremastrum niveocremeum HHB9708 TaxID=1314777 RepID=A0A164RNV9_9AGAM|nr:hypothetical protein SISNIDRAFT_175322 [Sistotremastrum niveocremeum HHB9708]